MNDLHHQIQTWKAEGDHIIAMGDPNKYILRENTTSFFASIGMQELITELHGKMARLIPGEI